MNLANSETLLYNRPEIAMEIMQRGVLISVGILGAAAVAWAVPRIYSEIRNKDGVSEG